MFKWPPSNGALAYNGNALAVLQEDGGIKTWGPSTSADPVTDFPALPGVKGVLPHPDGASQFLCLLDTGTLVTVDSSVGSIKQLNLFWNPNTWARTADVLDHPLALAGCTGGHGMYVNSAHEFVCNEAKTTSVHAILDAPYYMAGVKFVACNDDVAIVVMDDGTLDGWGNDTHGLLTFPGGATDVVEVALGAAHAVARKGDGTVVAWGDNTHGQTTVPGGLSGITQISAYYLGNFTLALKSDGSVHAWGEDTSGQVTGAASITNATRVSAGKRHACAVTTSASTTVAWGDNSQGQTSIATNGTSAAAANDASFLIVGAFVNYYGASGGDPGTTFSTSIGLPYEHALYKSIDRVADQIVVNGDISPDTHFDVRYFIWPNPGIYGYPAQSVKSASVCNDSNVCSVLRTAPNQEGDAVVPYFLGGFSNGNEAHTTATAGDQIDACSGGVLQAILAGGDISFWGVSGMLSAAIVTGFPGNATKTWVQVCLGAFAAAALADDGTVSAWGDNTSGAATVPGGLGSVRSLAVIAGFSGTSSQDTFIALLNDGTLALWGFNASSLSSAGLTSETNVAAIATFYGHDAVFVLRKDGSIAIYPSSFYPSPYTNGSMLGQQLVINGDTQALLKTSSVITTLNSTANGLCTVPHWPKTVQAVRAAGATRYMAENTDGSLAEWAVANNHKTGDFVCPFTLSDLVDYDGNDNVSLGVVKQAGFASGGAVVAWGPGAGSVSIPSAIAPGGTGLSFNPVMKVRCGSAHYMAMLADGSIIVWGDNSKNQITNAPGGNGFNDIASGFQTCFALKSGTVTAWGSTTSGATGSNGVTGVAAIASNASVDWVALLISGNPTVYGFPAFKAAAASPNNPSWTGITKIALGPCQVLGTNSSGVLQQWGPTCTGTVSPVHALPGGLPAINAFCPTNRGGMAVDASNVVHVWDNDARYPVAPNSPSSIKGNAFSEFSAVAVGSLWFVNPDGTLGGLGNSSLLPPPAGLGAILGFDYADDTANSPGVISSASSFAMAVKAGNTLAKWGSSAFSWTPAKPLADLRVKLGGSAGAAAFGLHTDGTVEVATQSTDTALTTIPSGLSGGGVVQIEFGKNSVLSKAYCAARKSDGTIAVWGESSNTVTGPLPTLTGVTKISCGPDHMGALKSDHTLAVWGTDHSGSVTTANGQTNVADFECGATGTIVRYLDGSIAAWPTYSAQPSVTGALGMAVDQSSATFGVIKSDHSVTYWNSSGATSPTDFVPVTVDGPLTTNDAFMRLGALSLAATVSFGGSSVDIEIEDGFTLGDTVLSQWIQSIAEKMGVAAGQTTLLDAIASVSEHAGFADVVTILFNILIGETVGLQGQALAWRAMVLELVDAMALASGTQTTLDASAAVAAAMAFGDTLNRLFPNAMTDGVVFNAVQQAQLDGLLAMQDTFRMQAAGQLQVQFAALVDENMALGDGATARADLQVLINEGVDLLAQITLDDGVYLAWVLNTESRAFMPYSNFHFNSFAAVGGKYYGARDDGLYLLEGDDDAGVPIDAFIRGGLSAPGGGLLTRQHAMYLGYTTSGQMVVKVTAINDAGIREEHWYSIEDRAAGALRAGRVKIGKGLKSTYWGWELANVDGADFALDTIAWYPMVLERRLS